MNRFPPSIKNIFQIDHQRFQIDWSDGVLGLYLLSELQKLCSCAGCRDEVTGQPNPSLYVDEKVSAVSLKSVGRYALKIQFSSGCSAGIYSFEQLHRLALKSRAVIH